VPNHPVTLISAIGHLHPGGLKVGLRVFRHGRSRRLFQSRAHYYEPAGAVSWDVSMTATPDNWRVQLQPGDTVSVHTTYDVSHADWYEVMGIMPVAVYDGTDVGGVDAFSKNIPQKGVLTHTHLNENRVHGRGKTTLPDPRTLPNGPAASALGTIGIQDYEYSQGDLYLPGAAADPPVIRPGQRLRFLNYDSIPSINTFHTITSCRLPCNRSTGIAYPIANGPTSFDSGQLGYNYAGWGAPAADRNTWRTPVNLKPGTYTFFCRIHPFMRGTFRVIGPQAGFNR
jgi:hypothetical protein